jgi:hypothetical protein
MTDKKTPRIEDLTFDEINAVLHHKWHLSEQLGRDVGIEFAATDFFEHHAAEWQKQQITADLAAQKEEILKHKWFISQQLGHDVGTAAAALDWVKGGFAQHWRDRTGPYKNSK